MRVPTNIKQEFGNNAQASLHYGTGSSSAKIVISKHNGFVSPLSTKTFGLYFVKNPAANEPGRTTLSIVKYPQNQPYPTIIQQVSYTNYFTAIAKDLSLGLPLNVELENYLPNQVAKLKMRKKYLSMGCEIRFNYLRESSRFG